MTTRAHDMHAAPHPRRRQARGGGAGRLMIPSDFYSILVVYTSRNLLVSRHEHGADTTTTLLDPGIRPAQTTVVTGGSSSLQHAAWLMQTPPALDLDWKPARVRRHAGSGEGAQACQRAEAGGSPTRRTAGAAIRIPHRNLEGGSYAAYGYTEFNAECKSLSTQATRLSSTSSCRLPAVVGTSTSRSLRLRDSSRTE